MPNAERVDLALRAVQTACAITRDLQVQLRRDEDVLTKADRSPVTVADLAAQAVIGLHLEQSFVGEETTRTLEAAPALVPRVLSAARRFRPQLTEAEMFDALRLGEDEPKAAGFWTLDPVDGTKGFIRGAQYCVSLAWVEGGVPRFGVLGCPRLGTEVGQVEGTGALFWAVEGEAPLCADLEGDRTARRLEPPGGMLDAITVAESAEAAHSDLTLAGRLLAESGLTAAPPLRVDSQVKYALVARGDAQVFVRRPRAAYVERIWDHAAGSLVARSAGCRVTDLDGRELDFSQGRGLENNRGVLVARPELHGRLVEALARLEAAERG